MEENLESFFNRVILKPLFQMVLASLLCFLIFGGYLAYCERKKNLDFVASELSIEFSKMLDRGDWDAVIERVGRFENVNADGSISLPGSVHFGKAKDKIFQPLCSNFELVDRGEGSICVSVLDLNEAKLLLIMCSILCVLVFATISALRTKIKKVGRDLKSHITGIKNILQEASVTITSTSDKIGLSEFVELEKLFFKVLIPIQEEAEQANNRVREFAHDLRSPIGVVKAIRSRLEGQPEELEIIGEAAGRLSNLLDDFLSSTPNTRLKRAVFREFFLIFAGLKIKAERQNAKLEFHMECQNNEKTVNFLEKNFMNLTRIISNLVENAVTAAPRASGESAFSRADFTVADDLVVIRVSNQLSRDQLPCDQAANGEKSYGIGLTVVDNLTLEMSGTLKFDFDRENVAFVQASIPIP
jgi:signal transduction histidine kinase